MRISEWKNSKEENQGILKLTENAYGDIEINDSNYFNWQYNENPYGPAQIVLGIDDEKNDLIVGQLPSIPTILSLGSKDIQSSLTLNVAVHSDYRQKGIFSKLLNSLPEQSLARRISCTFGVTNTKSYNVYLKQGWKEITKLPLLIRPLNPSRYFENFLKIFLKPIDLIYEIKPSNNSSIQEFNNNFNDDFDRLTSKLYKRVLAQKRNHNFLQWRYKNHPTRQYTTHVMRRNSELIGYIITRTTEYNGKPVGIILDFVIDTDIGDDTVFINLVKFALLGLQKKQIALCIATVPPLMPEYKILRKAGFFRLPEFLKPEPLPFVVNIFDKSDSTLDYITKYENWFFTFGDYDVF